MLVKNDDYIPIDCGLHSQYELAIMQQTKTVIRWIDDQQIQHDETIEPLDLITRNKKEYMTVKTGNNEIIDIRLDKIIQFKPLT